MQQLYVITELTKNLSNMKKYLLSMKCTVNSNKTSFKLCLVFIIS